LANARELADWMTTVTGRYTELIEAPGARPVPLKYLFATREGLFPLFRNADAGPGSSLGLLGYRGDGIPPTPQKSNKNQRNGSPKSEENEISIVKKLPRGLQINPALTGLAQRRIQKVNRMIERRKASQYENSGDSDWYAKGRGRGRGRKSDDSSQFSSRESRKERERLTRKEMRKAVPSLTILLTRLREKNLLPAIFFIFSRAGCDQAAEDISKAFFFSDMDMDLLDDDSSKQNKKKDKLRKKSSREKRRRGKPRVNDNDVLKDSQGRSFRLSSNNVNEDVFNSVLDANDLFSGPESFFSISGSPLSSENWDLFSSVGLLNVDEVKQVARRVAQFNEENSEIAFPDNIIDQLLLGLGRHHAGMLPAHKILIEE
jgi:superfamily II RNA helicase